MTRRTFSNLPDEILLSIFGKLAYGDLRECLTVCHSWHRRVKAELGMNVRLRNDKDIESFLNYIEKNPEFTANVNGLDLHIGDRRQKISRHMIEKLFDRKFDIIELRVNPAMLFIRDLYLNVLKACPKLEHICCWDKLAYSMSRQKLPKGVSKPVFFFGKQPADLRVSMYGDIDYDPYNGRGPVRYVLSNDREYIRFVASRRRECIYYGASESSNSFFPPMNSESWLNLFRQQFTLETLKIELNQDKRILRYSRQGLNETETKTIENLSKLKSLQVQNKLFCAIPVQFISEYMTGLQELKLTQKIAFEESWTDTKLQEFYDSFSDLLPRLHICDVHLLVRKGTVFPSTIIEKFYQQSSPYHRRSKRIFELAVGMFDETITLISEKYGNEKTQKLVTIEFERESSFETLVNSIISTLKINAFRLSRYGPNFPDDYIQLLQSTLDNLPDATEVSCCISSTIFTCENPPWKQYPQVTHLELHSGDDTIYSSELKNFTRVFNNTVSLRLSHIFSFMIGGKYGVDLGSLKLERLYLDISASWSKHSCNPASRSNFLTLDVQSKGQHHFYKILNEGLHVTKISNNEDIEELKKKVKYFSLDLLICIWADEVQFITLYLDKDFYYCEWADEQEQSKNGSEISLHVTP